MTQQTKLEGWTLQENGDLDCKPMVGYGIVPFGAGMAAILRVEWATEPSCQETASQQVALTLPGLLDLIQSLSRVAAYMGEQLEARKPTTNPN